MSASAKDYYEQIKKLKPSGQAWPDEDDLTQNRLLQALADESARIDERADDLSDELDPRVTLELLMDWERTAGLPDPCTGLAQTVELRRQAVVDKLNARGGQHKQYFIDLAARFGFVISITETWPTTAGMPCGIGDYGDTWLHYWEVNAPLDTIRHTKTGIGSCGDPIRSWGNEILECLINRYKPAHTIVIFTYS
ncbi:YmfQ family protein [Vampirovibrio chlorellavorus]|uniref:YmfQ family protein n=1 Tax=Vampirovibrio chlorellavorus TaxID=758823 RepID=UPI0026F21F39|nr:putative phage tail protein [Vampirovibrio chlorellavorus]